jgi:hypothetical protein
MNGIFERFVVKWRGTTRKPGGLSNIGLVIWCSSCNDAAKEKRLTFFGVIDRAKSGLFGRTNTGMSIIEHPDASGVDYISLETDR